MSHRVVAVIADPISGPEAVEQLRYAADDGEVELLVIAPQVEANLLRHTLGDVDEPRREASERLQASLDSLREAGLEARGEIGDPDPVQAARDALLEAPADEVVIFEREAPESRWFEGDLTARAEEAIEPPLRIVTLASPTAPGTPSHVAAIAVALVNMAHVVGLLLMESVRYRGGFARFFRTLSLMGTPTAVLLNLIILLSS